MKIVTQALIAILMLSITCASVYAVYRNDSYFRVRRKENTATKNIRKIIDNKVERDE